MYSHALLPHEERIYASSICIVGRFESLWSLSSITLLPLNHNQPSDFKNHEQFSVPLCAWVECGCGIRLERPLSPINVWFVCCVKLFCVCSVLAGYISFGMVRSGAHRSVVPFVYTCATPQSLAHYAYVRNLVMFCGCRMEIVYVHVHVHTWFIWLLMHATCIWITHDGVWQIIVVMNMNSIHHSRAYIYIQFPLWHSDLNTLLTQLIRAACIWTPNFGVRLERVACIGVYCVLEN